MNEPMRIERTGLHFEVDRKRVFDAPEEVLMELKAAVLVHVARTLALGGFLMRGWGRVDREDIETGDLLREMEIVFGSGPGTMDEDGTREQKDIEDVTARLFGADQPIERRRDFYRECAANADLLAYQLSRLQADPPTLIHENGRPKLYTASAIEDGKVKPDEGPS